MQRLPRLIATSNISKYLWFMLFSLLHTKYAGVAIQFMVMLHFDMTVIWTVVSLSQIYVFLPIKCIDVCCRYGVLRLRYHFIRDIMATFHSRMYLCVICYEYIYICIYIYTYIYLHQYKYHQDINCRIIIVRRASFSIQISKTLHIVTCLLTLTEVRYVSFS